MLIAKASFAGLALLIAGLLVYQFHVRASTPPLLPCDRSSSLYLKIHRGSLVVQLSRDQLAQPWQPSSAGPRTVDQGKVATFLDAVHSMQVINTIDHPNDASRYGLLAPAASLDCRVADGGSYTLSVGDPSFDSSGYYSRKAGDGRVYVIANDLVTQFDRALVELAPQQPSTSSGSSPTPSPSP